MARNGRARGEHPGPFRTVLAAAGAAVLTAGLGAVGVPPAAGAVAGAFPADQKPPSFDRPVAIALDQQARTYVGFATSGDLARLSPKGKVLKPVRLAGSGPVSGLDVTRSNNIWVDDGSRATLIEPDGTVITSFRHGPDGACPNDAGRRAGRYGGIEAWGNTVFVANRCERSVEVFRRGGKRVARLPLPGAGYPRGMAFLPGHGHRIPRLYVALPDRRRVVVYDGRSWRSGERPVRRLRVPKPRGGLRPEPAGVVIDRYGQLVVSDLANHALYFFDTRAGFSLYRTLGHPPRPGRAWGHLNRPTAIAQHRQDRSRFSGTIVVADQRNRRVQRWNSYGWTYWVRGVSAPS